MILNVPYKSQEPYETKELRKWCGIVSLWMILTFYLKDSAPTVEELLEKYGEEFEFGGFEHKSLLKIAREYGLSGYRKSWWAEPGVNALLEKFQSEGETAEEINQWLETNIDESFYTLEKLVNQKIPVILSVTSEFSPSNSTHLVVLIGVENKHFIIHDPYKRGESFKISQDDFKKFWLRQAIIIRND